VSADCPEGGRLCSFVSDRQQRVKNVLSEWASPNGGMPQGTWLGVCIFLILINDLSAVNLHKFVDDCTLSEAIYELASNVLHREVNELNNWSTDYYMKINTRKTKEMLIGHIKN